MSMEHMGDLYEQSQMGVENLLQVRLAEMHGEDMETFVDKHAENFRKTVNTRPELLQQYGADPEAVLRALDEIIYPQQH